MYCSAPGNQEALLETEPVVPAGIERKLDALEDEKEALYEQFEKAITRANSLEVKAEIARLEFNQVFNAIDDAIWIIDQNETVLRLNDALAAMLDVGSKTDVIGKKCHERICTDLCRTPECPLKQIKKGIRRFEKDVEIRNSEGQPIPFWLTATPLRGLVNETIGIVVQYRDITERKHYENELKKANAQLQRLATMDGLTGLANRRCFDETLQREWARMRREGNPLSLVLCDVDYFKRYNDHYGHQQGDKCLKELADVLRTCVYRPADLAARYGGEEFVVILPNTNAVGARRVAERIRTSVLSMKREHAHSKVNSYVTLSLGVATAVPFASRSTPENLLKAADKALYASKEAGRNTVTVRDLRFIEKRET